MTNELPIRDLRLHLIEDLAEVEAAVEGYRGGRIGAYQTVAIQLRNLLTDHAPRAGALLTRVIPDARFHRLRPPPSEFSSGSREGRVTVFTFDPRGTISLGGGSPILALEVTEDLIALDEWLDDWIVKPGLRIRDLIH